MLLDSLLTLAVSLSIISQYGSVLMAAILFND
jgi:hypothetical protein